METEYFVDIECLKNAVNHLVVKELAIAPAKNHSAPQSWLFRPPCQFIDLPGHIRSQNRWITYHLHGIRWNNGTEQYEHLMDVLKDNIQSGATVYVKGQEKANFIRTMLPSDRQVK